MSLWTQNITECPVSGVERLQKYMNVLSMCNRGREIGHPDNSQPGIECLHFDALWALHVPQKLEQP